MGGKQADEECDGTGSLASWLTSCLWDYQELAPHVEEYLQGAM